MLRLWTAYQAYIRNEEGASMVEYALLVALIAIVVIAGAFFLGGKINDTLSDVGDSVANRP